jgi:hypothetical protein
MSVQVFLFAKDEEAVEAAFKGAVEALAVDEDSEDLELDHSLTTQFKKAAEAKWREIGVVGKIHNLVVLIRGSNDRSNRFLRLAGEMIPLDNDTRWNSWFMMLEVALDFKPAIKTFMDEYSEDLQLDYLTPADWKELKLTYEFLQPFWHVTKETEDDRATLDQTLYTMDFLVSHFKASEVRLTLVPTGFLLIMYRPSIRITLSL